MKPRDILIGTLAVVLLGTLGYLWLAPAGLKHSPDITLLTIDGEELRLADKRGKPMLVTFWATTCSGCIKEMPHLIELHEELAPRGLQIVGIAMDYDPPSQVLAMRKSRNIPYTIALDLNAGAARAFGNVRLTPTSFLIDPQGLIVYQKLGEMDMKRVRETILGMLETNAADAASVAPADSPA